MSAEVYILGYRDKFIKPIDNFYKVIYCGKTDNTGDNISDKNPYFVETTGIYWIWKNTFSDYVGQMQYRRHLSVNPNYIESILKDYDIITATPLRLPYSIETQYMYKHNLNDILEIKNIIDRLYPEYSSSYDKYIKYGDIIFYSNSFITKREIYNDLCNFCFSILFEFEKKYNLQNEEDRYSHAKEALLNYPDEKEVSHSGEDNILYQSRFCGYLFERLVTLYIFHNRLRIYTCGDYIKMENNMVL